MQAVEVIAEEVAANLEEVAVATRSLNTSAVGYLVGGLLIGGAVGFYFGRKINKAKLRAEAFAEAEEEIEEIREVYRAKTVAVENATKPDPAELTQELGYSVRDDMGMTMPTPTRERPLPAPVPITNVFVEASGDVTVKKNPDDGWDQARELNARTATAPYVIHQNEFGDPDMEYTQQNYTYYDGDEVMVDDEDGEPIANAVMVIGEENLKWGHGSDEEDVVFVRNDRFELDIKITRSPKSYEEEVVGLENGNAN